MPEQNEGLVETATLLAKLKAVRGAFKVSAEALHELFHHLGDYDSCAKEVCNDSKTVLTVSKP